MPKVVGYVVQPGTAVVLEVQEETRTAVRVVRARGVEQHDVWRAKAERHERHVFQLVAGSGRGALRGDRAQPSGHRRRCEPAARGDHGCVPRDCLVPDQRVPATSTDLVIRVVRGRGHRTNLVSHGSVAQGVTERVRPPNRRSSSVQCSMQLRVRCARCVPTSEPTYGPRECDGVLLFALGEDLEAEFGSAAVAAIPPELCRPALPERRRLWPSPARPS